MNKFEKLIDGAVSVFAAALALVLSAIVVVLEIILKCALPIGVIVLSLCIAKHFGLI